MPTDIDAGGVMRVIIEGMLDQQICQNVWHFRAVAATTLEATENEINNGLLSLTANFISNEFQFTRVSVQGLSPVHTDPYEEGKAFNGQHTGVSLPVANAIVVALKTGLAGRKNRGRKYFPGVVESEVDNSRVDTDYKLLIQTNMDNLNNRYKPGGSTNWEWGLVDKLPSNGDYDFRPFNSVICRDVLGTMRSRLPGHGR